jgi:hypothetical protein
MIRLIEFFLAWLILLTITSFIWVLLLELYFKYRKRK